MNNFPSLKEYLSARTATLKTQAELQELKRVYRNLYHQEYMRRKKDLHTITLRITKRECKHLQKNMKEHNYTSMNKFLLDCIQAYLSQGYVFPNKKDTQDLNKYLRSISNSIAQIAQKIHVYCLRNKSQSNQLDTGIENLTKLLKGIELLQEDVEKIKTATNVFTATPQSKVLEFTWDEIKDNQDNRLDTLITFLTTYRNNLPCQSSNQ